MRWAIVGRTEFVPGEMVIPSLVSLILQIMTPPILEFQKIV